MVKRESKPKSRVGQTVQSICNPAHRFVIGNVCRNGVKRHYQHHRKPNARILVSFFMDMQGEVVYGWRRGTKYLYFGRTSNLLSRLSHHHIVGRAEPFQRKDVIDVWFFHSALDALAFEAKLQRIYQPLYSMTLGNGPLEKPEERVCLGCKTPFKPTRAWQKFCSSRCRGRDSEGQSNRRHAVVA